MINDTANDSEQEENSVETGKYCLSMIDNIMMYYRKITNILIHINLIHSGGRYWYYLFSLFTIDIFGHHKFLSRTIHH